VNEQRVLRRAGLKKNREMIGDLQKNQFQKVLDLLSEKLLEDELTIGVAFPYVTGADGAWLTMLASESASYKGERWSHGNWFCGFWIGLLLAAYLHTGRERFQKLADERMQLVAQRADDPNTHDIGFIFNSSAVPAAHIAGGGWYADLALRAANRLRARVITTKKGAYISSWGPQSDPRGRRSSAIDTLANLPLLYWAADTSKDGSFRLAAEAHALTSREAFVRPDMSTYHAVEYDDVSGERLRAYTFQGAANESCWSRGQAWAILGFAATASATGKREYLELAERLADYFLFRLGNDSAPYWDFDDPAIPNAPRDTSASAIVATALLDIADLHPDSVAAETRRQQGVRLLEGLCSDHLALSGPQRGLLRHGCYSRPHNEGTDCAVLFGDFYFVEALCKALMPGRLRPLVKRLRSLSRNTTSAP
jgi:unsaturated chondroitin disaccharide hydrolase